MKDYEHPAGRRKTITKDGQCPVTKKPSAHAAESMGGVPRPSTDVKAQEYQVGHRNRASLDSSQEAGEEAGQEARRCELLGRKMASVAPQ